jgi:2-isopropylmalate synthase
MPGFGGRERKTARAARGITTIGGETVAYEDKDFFYEWNKEDPDCQVGRIEINDETLRDGIQASGIRYPSLESKIRIVTLIAHLGIDAACIGFPASGPAMMRDLEGIIRHVQEHGIDIGLACAARTVKQDIALIVELSQKFGLAIDANIFIGSSPIRQYVEGWDLAHMLRLVEGALGFARSHHLPVCFITEDTTRSRPEDLRRLYRTAVQCGAYRLCVCDTVGYATPGGTASLVGFIRSVLQEEGVAGDILIDWHGHNDRGLALANALAALEAGVNRVHATGLGLGERTGNTAMEQLLIHLQLEGLRQVDLLKLKEYCQVVRRACGVKIPANFPILGSRIFTTASGVHAAAILKAQRLDDHWLADRVYSSVPARELGFEQKIEMGPLSGKSNFRFFLQKHNIQDDDLLNDIFVETRQKGSPLTRQELRRVFEKYGYSGI